MRSAMFGRSIAMSIVGSLVACSASTPLQSTTAAPPPADDGGDGDGDVDDDHAPPPSAPLTPEVCRDTAEARGADPACPHWVIRTYSYSGGVAPQPGTPTSWPGCVCDRCEVDSECTEHAGGECRELPSPRWGDPPARVCVHPDDECYEPESCEQQCMLEGTGSACRSMEPPPP